MNLYHLSLDKLKSNIMIHRIPHCAIPSSYEDMKTKRICFSTSINGALSSLQGDYGIYYVYRPKDIDMVELYKPTTYQVFDVDVTNELWVLNDIEVECIGTIFNKGIIYSTIFPMPMDDNDTFTHRLCDWEWLDCYII